MNLNFLASIFNAFVFMFFTIRVIGYLRKNVESLIVQNERAGNFLITSTWISLKMSPQRSVEFEREVHKKLNPIKYK